MYRCRGKERHRRTGEVYRYTVTPTSSHPVIGWCETLIRGICTGSIGVRGDTGGQVGV